MLPGRFDAFRYWDQPRLRTFLVDGKERVLVKGECLVREQTISNYIFFLLQGKLKVEKEVVVHCHNAWPDSNGNRFEKRVQDRVLF